VNPPGSLGNPERAVQVIKERNPFPAVIGRICPRPCEQDCRRKLVDEPVAINYLKRYAADVEQASGYSQAIAATAPMPAENPVTESKVQIDHNRHILANQNTRKAGKYVHADSPQEFVQVSSGSQEIGGSIHLAEPVISLSSEQPSVSVQSNLSPDLLEAARLRLSSPIQAETFQAVLPEAAINPVNTALLIEDAVKDEEQNIFRGIIRRINRVIHDETEEPDRKFIQVANFQIPVKH
jgi:hypothetical protein